MNVATAVCAKFWTHIFFTAAHYISVTDILSAPRYKFIDQVTLAVTCLTKKGSLAQMCIQRLFLARTELFLLGLLHKKEMNGLESVQEKCALLSPIVNEERSRPMHFPLPLVRAEQTTDLL